MVAVALALFGLSLLGGSMSGAALTRPTLAVMILGRGGVVSSPVGISCPGRCTAPFPSGTRVLLTARAKAGARFLRWGGSCVGAGACTVRVSALSAVAAEFSAGVHPAPQPTTKTVAEPGTYSLYNIYRTFFVAPGGRSVANIAISGVAIACTPALSGAPTTDAIVIPKAAIRGNGSFVGKGSQRGLFAGFPATFTYSFAGRFTPASTGKPAGATGTLREDVVLKADNVTHRCTTNTQSWTAAKTGPIPQRASLVQAGAYSLYNSYRTFSVAPGKRSMVNIAIAGVAIACTPTEAGVPTTDQIVIAQTPIRPDGSFAGKSSQSGVFAKAQAKFTYTFTGNFQGQDSSGNTTVAGQLREDIVFTDSAGTHVCTSNGQSWTAIRSS